jgi:hypothetical protein
LTTISEQGFFVTYGHDDPCKIRGDQRPHLCLPIWRRRARQ